MGMAYLIELLGYRIRVKTEKEQQDRRVIQVGKEYKVYVSEDDVIESLLSGIIHN